ncbi:MAG: molybdopterin/thiamine biosynthesis adenylyltransferase [Paraglaciecola sp.]|jgi:molybdopterin/thiamine biosynthesis adenylyltransferase
MTNSEQPPITPLQAMRFARQILLPGIDLDGQETLLAAKVLIIGVGGLGCAAAQYLVAAGIGSVTLVDDDVVDTSNLQRQVLHNEQSVGQAKVDSAKATLSAINSLCVVHTINKRLAVPDLTVQIDQHDVVLDCTDNLLARQQINAACFTLRTPLVSGAAIRFEGQLSTFLMDGHSPCYLCLSQTFAEQQLSCVQAGVMGPVVGIIGNMQALETIKLLTGTGQLLAGKLLLFDGSTMEFQTFNIAQHPQCQVCGHGVR